MGTPSEELFLCILMINAMTGISGLETTQGLVAQDLAKSRPDSNGKPMYTSSDINVALDIAQSLADVDKKGNNIALMAQGSRSVDSKMLKPRVHCTNPHCP